MIGLHFGKKDELAKVSETKDELKEILLKLTELNFEKCYGKKLFEETYHTLSLV